MVASLKKGSPQPLDLYISAREFLRVFTDAVAHIPRHRRNRYISLFFREKCFQSSCFRFFRHLTEVLGYHDFLAPICMLLLDKPASRMTRQTEDDLQYSMSVPIFVFQSAEPALQILVGIIWLLSTIPSHTF